MDAKVILVKKIDVEPPLFLDTAVEADPAAELEDLRLVEHLRRKGIKTRKPRADRGPLHQSRIQIIDRHTGKRGISRATSMVHHLIAMAVEAHLTPEELVRSIIAESPEFRTEMKNFWSRENAGWHTPERGAK
jgi:hypothetical protein